VRGVPSSQTPRRLTGFAPLIDSLALEAGRAGRHHEQPTDAAFARLPKGEIETLLKDKEKQMHDGDRMKTVSGKEFTLGLKDNVVTVNGSVVSKTDLTASNGVIHAIDTVIFPN
jgi:uncharacterized surface protein with fasciclin (FAS1) repeats